MKVELWIPAETLVLWLWPCGRLSCSIFLKSNIHVFVQKAVLSCTFSQMLKTSFETPPPTSCSDVTSKTFKIWTLHKHRVRRQAWPPRSNDVTVPPWILARVLAWLEVFQSVSLIHFAQRVCGCSWYSLFCPGRDWRGTASPGICDRP